MWRPLSLIKNSYRVCTRYTISVLQILNIQIECVSLRGPSMDTNENLVARIFTFMNRSKNLDIPKVKFSHMFMWNLVGLL